MDLKPVYLLAAYLIGVALIAVGIGFFDWRFGLVALGVGVVAPIVAMPSEVKK